MKVGTGEWPCTVNEGFLGAFVPTPGTGALLPRFLIFQCNLWYRDLWAENQRSWSEAGLDFLCCLEHIIPSWASGPFSIALGTSQALAAFSLRLPSIFDTETYLWNSVLNQIKDRVWGEVEKNSLIVLPGKGEKYGGLLPSKVMSQPRGLLRSFIAVGSRSVCW